MKNTKVDIIGTWQLVSWVRISNKGEEQSPFGEDALGYLIYSECGVMSVHLSHKKRELFQSPSVFLVTSDEALMSYHTYTSYSGRFEVKEDKILHHVEMHTSPNWVGTVQERFYKLKGDVLYLSHHLEDSRQQLTWKKISGHL